MIRRAGSIVTALLLGSAALAEDAERDAYVEANLLSIFYHELGHALIDVMNLPVLGQEEDAADTISVLMIDLFNDEETAQAFLRDAAYGFLDEDAATDGAEPPWWDVHGPDLQRYYNMVCQFYGGSVADRQPLADDLGLPVERAESCEEEFDLAYDSFEPVLDDLTAAAPGMSITYNGATDSLTEQLIAAEVAHLNTALVLPDPITVNVARCEEANAYYDPEMRSITMCSELESHLVDLYAQ